MIDPLLMTTVRVGTFQDQRGLTNATGFFFRRNGQLQLITSRHVVLDEATGHRPDRIEIELHTDPDDLGRSTHFSIPLYWNGKSVWREAKDASGLVDVAAIDIHEVALPRTTAFRAFTPENLLPADAHVEIGTTLVTLGYPLGFQDTLHHLPVARQAGLASSYGLRFKGMGYFLVDARTHRGISGAPVVMRDPQAAPGEPLPWRLLGIHAARLEASTRDPALDETLGLNAVWYADVLLALGGAQGA
jgi:hypothetical protein